MSRRPSCCRPCDNASPRLRRLLCRLFSMFSQFSQCECVSRRCSMFMRMMMCLALQAVHSSTTYAHHDRDAYALARLSRSRDRLARTGRDIHVPVCSGGTNSGARHVGVAPTSTSRRLPRIDIAMAACGTGRYVQVGDRRLAVAASARRALRLQRTRIRIHKWCGQLDGLKCHLMNRTEWSVSY